MSTRIAPFEEVQDGLPLWRIQVEDPSGAASERRELNWRVLEFPEGRVFALVLRVFDGAGKPVIFHHAMLMGSQPFINLKSAGAMTLVFERHGFISDAKARLEINLAPLQGGAPGTAAALERYVNAYRGGIAKKGSPEGAWDEIESGLAKRPKAGAGRGLGWVLILLLLAALGVAAYILHLKGML